jgi:hypothetical protein
MPSSRMRRLVALVRTHVSEQPIASIIRVERIREPGKTLAVTGNSFLTLLITEILIFTGFFFCLLKFWVTQNFLTIKTSWNTND